MIFVPHDHQTPRCEISRARILVIVPCGARKIWERNFLAGPTLAKDAYISAAFRLHRKYAETFGTDWRILSAWYGLTHPDQIIRDYEARFTSSDLAPGNWWRLKGMCKQARALPKFDRVILLGGSVYRRMARRILEGIFLPREIAEPFAGLDLFRSNRAIRRSIAAGRPGPIEP